MPGTERTRAVAEAVWRSCSARATRAASRRVVHAEAGPDSRISSFSTSGRGPRRRPRAPPRRSTSSPPGVIVYRLVRPVPCAPATPVGNAPDAEAHVAEIGVLRTKASMKSARERAPPRRARRPLSYVGGDDGARLRVHQERELRQPQQVGRAVHTGPMAEPAEPRVQPAPLRVRVRVAEVEEAAYLDRALLGGGRDRNGERQRQEDEPDGTHARGYPASRRRASNTLNRHSTRTPGPVGASQGR